MIFFNQGMLLLGSNHFLINNHSKTRKNDSSNLYCRLQYLPMRAFMVSTAITVVGAMPPKLKVQSLIFHKPLHRSLSNNTLMQVLTMAKSLSHLRDCLKANTYSCCKQFSKKLYYINWSTLLGFPPLRKTISPHAKNYNTFSCVFENRKIIHDICLEIWNFSSCVQLDTSLVCCAHL